MTKDPNLAEWNSAVISLVQAMIGAVSANFRMVALQRAGDVWHVKYWLEAESAVDRGEIEDIDFEFANFMNDALTSFEIAVTGDEVLLLPDPPTRTVFRRRELHEAEDW